jgi:hypothetical protein
LPNRLELHLLIHRQLVLKTNCQLHVQTLDFTFALEHFVELREGELLVDGIAFDRLMQRFHLVLHLPLKFVEARRRALNLSAHKCLLIVSQREFALMLHDHIGWKNRITERVRWRRRFLSLPLRLRLRGSLSRLLRHDERRRARKRDHHCHSQNPSLAHITSPYRFSRLGRNDFSSLAFSFSCGSDLNKPSLGELKRSEVGDCQLAIALASPVNS